MYTLSARSHKALESCHTDLRTLAQSAITCTQVDFMVLEGYRSIARQHELYKAGRSKIDGINKQGTHNVLPSLAFDICAFVGGCASWDVAYLTYLGGVLTALALKLKQEGKILHALRWGGNWDGDGKIIKDQNFIDLPHFEILAQHRYGQKN